LVRSNKKGVTYKATPEVSSLRDSVVCKTNVLVGVDHGIASKVEPAVLEVLIYNRKEKQFPIRQKKRESVSVCVL